MHIVAAKIISHFSAIHKPSGCGTIPSRASHRSISRPIENLHTGLALRSFTRIRKSQKVVSARRTSRIPHVFFSGGFNLVVGVSVARHQVALTAARHARAHRLFARSVLRLPPVMRRRPRPVQSPPANSQCLGSLAADGRREQRPAVWFHRPAFVAAFFPKPPMLRCAGHSSITELAWDGVNGRVVADLSERLAASHADAGRYPRTVGWVLAWLVANHH